jgi:hypothetical protein
MRQRRLKSIRYNMSRATHVAGWCLGVFLFVSSSFESVNFLSFDIDLNLQKDNRTTHSSTEIPTSLQLKMI